jgi:hypothetical protein
MLTLNEYKKLLGHAGENLSDEEVSRIRDALHELADIALEVFAQSSPSKSANQIIGDEMEVN